MPYSEGFKIAARRLLSEKEYKKLENSNSKTYKGIKKK